MRAPSRSQTWRSSAGGSGRRSPCGGSHSWSCRRASRSFPVIGWVDPLKDIARIREFVTADKAPVAYAVLIDEGRFYRPREAHPDSEWIDWDARSPEGHAVSILWARWPRA